MVETNGCTDKADPLHPNIPVSIFPAQTRGGSRLKQSYGMAWDSMGKDKTSTKKHSKTMYLEEFAPIAFAPLNHNIWSFTGRGTDLLRTNHKQRNFTVITVNKSLILPFYICSYVLA
jgi:hypothetical protein